MNDYTIVVQEYFQQRVITWLETVGKDVFDIDHYWVRYEFAPGRGQIHAHLLAIVKDQTIFEQCYDDLQCEGGNHIRSQRLAKWAEESFGLTASVSEGFDSKFTDYKDIPRAEKHINNPVTLRYTDLPATESVQVNDGEALLHFCELHDCSKFCLRPGNEKW